MQKTKADEDILKVVDPYIEGWKGHKESFFKAFHPDAWIFYTDENGQVHKSLLSDCFADWASTNWIIYGEIISVTQIGDIANVVMEFNNQTDPSLSFLDSLNLVCESGEWKITNKTATHQSRINRSV